MNALDRPAILQRYRDRINHNERTKLTGEELQALVDSFIEQLKAATTAAQIQSLCSAEMALLEEGYSQATVSKQYVPSYRRAIRAAAESGALPMTEATSRHYSYTKRNSDETGEAHDHRSLDFFKYDNQKYREFAQTSAQHNNTKQDNLRPIEPNKFLAKTIELLNSTNPFEMAAGLAAATGRRFSEVVDKGTLEATAQPYWVSFAGQLKKKSTAQSYLTPCLVPTVEVLAALERLRTHPRIAKLKGRSPRAINSSIANSVKRTIDRHFGKTGIVPTLSGESSTTIHNLRGVYGELSVHFFCPPSQATARFVQARLGHVISDEELKRANATATQHYFHYYLMDEQGQHIGSKGVKLAEGGQPPAPIELNALTSDRRDEMTSEPQAAEQADTAQPSETPEAIAVIEPIELSESAEIEPIATLEGLGQVESTETDSSKTPEAIEPIESPATEPIEAENLPEPSEPLAATDAPSFAPAAAIATLAEQIQSLSQTVTQEIQRLWSHIDAMNTPTPTATDTSFFTREIETLRQQLEDAQQERDQAAAELEQARIQNIQLQGRIASLQHEYELQRAADHQFFQSRIDQLTTIIRNTPPTSPVTAQPVEAEAQSTLPKAEQAIAPTATVSPTPQPKQPSLPQPRPKHTTTRGSADQRVERAMLAIQEWNRHHSNLDEKFALTQSLLQKTTGSNMPAVRRVMADFQNQIVEHHAEHGIDVDRHNYAKNFEEIKRFVQQQL